MSEFLALLAGTQTHVCTIGTRSQTLIVQGLFGPHDTDKWGNFTRSIYECETTSQSLVQTLTRSSDEDTWQTIHILYIPIVLVLQQQSYSHELPRPTYVLARLGCFCTVQCSTCTLFCKILVQCTLQYPRSTIRYTCTELRTVLVQEVLYCTSCTDSTIKGGKKIILC